MSFRRCVLITGAPFGIGAVYADCSVRSDSGVVPARSMRAAFQRQFQPTSQGQAHPEDHIRLENRCRERWRILHELRDTLFQGFLGASMRLHAVEQTPADSLFKRQIGRARRVIRRIINEGRVVLKGLHTDSLAPSSLEQTISSLLSQVMTARRVRVRLFVYGKPRALTSVIQEQLFLIVRKAVMNALCHFEATRIEVEIQYLHCVVRVFVRDNGCGIDPEVVRSAGSSHWGLREMRERADNIGAQFGIWSMSRAGTEIRVGFPVDSATVQNNILNFL